MRIILIRHTESEANINNVYSGAIEYDLTQTGIEQIGKVIETVNSACGNVFKDIKKVYTSPLKRCVDLSNSLISSRLANDLELLSDERLIEFNFGIFDGLTNKQITEKYKDEYNNWCSDYINYSIPNGESLNDCYKRSCTFIDELIEKNQSSVIITHGGIMKLLAIRLLNLDLEHYWKFYFGNGAIVDLEYENNFGFIRNIINLI